MREYYPYIGKILFGIEFLSALVAVFYLFRLKNIYWKWFAFYVIFIFIQEFFWRFNTSLFSVRKQDYFAFVGIPIQYLFFYWLYALKSLKNKKLFIIFTLIYVLTYIPLEFFLKKIDVIYSINLTVGTILLTILIVLEFKKQIITDDILKFKENKMFYINLGVILFYIGTYPFFTFYNKLINNSYTDIWNIYYLYFLISNCLMYLLFTASFIWGEKSFIAMLILFNVIFIAFIGGIIIFIREYKIKKKAHLKEISTIDEVHKEELLETQVEIQQQTMQYIGQEIHDNIGQKLTLASLYAQQLMFENKTPHINDNIKGINDIINQSLIELRQLSKSLTDDTIKKNTITELIESECEKINDLKRCSIEFLRDQKVNVQSYQIKSILYRITQEFLQNSIKHSNCKKIVVSLHKTDDSMQLVLKDDGVGFNTDNIKSNGIGLKNIQKRTKLIGGTLILESQESIGTTLTIKIPL